jgi:hypothetical protein
VGRTFVGGRSLVAGVGGLGQLRLGSDEPVRQLRDLAGELEDDAVLLFDVALQESEAFLEGALVIIHVGKMEADPGRARRYDNPASSRPESWFGG